MIVYTVDLLWLYIFIYIFGIQQGANPVIAIVIVRFLMEDGQEKWEALNVFLKLMSYTICNGQIYNRHSMFIMI